MTCYLGTVIRIISRIGDPIKFLKIQYKVKQSLFRPKTCIWKNKKSSGRMKESLQQDFIAIENKSRNTKIYNNFKAKRNDKWRKRKKESKSYLYEIVILRQLIRNNNSLRIWSLHTVSKEILSVLLFLFFHQIIILVVIVGIDGASIWIWLLVWLVVYLF